MPGDRPLRSTPPSRPLASQGVHPNVADRDEALQGGEPVDPSGASQARPRPADGRFPGGRPRGATKSAGSSRLAPMGTLPSARVDVPSRLTSKQADVLDQAQHALKQARKFESGTQSNTQEKARRAVRHLFEGGNAPTGPDLIALHAGGHLEAAELQDALSLSALFAPDDVSHQSMLLLAKHLGSPQPADARSAALSARLRAMNEHPDMPLARRETVHALLAHLEGPWKTQGFRADTQALDKLGVALAGAQRVANVKSQPVLSDFIAQMEPQLGKEDTETSKIWENIFDSKGDLKVDALVAQFKTSKVPSIFRALNQASWCGSAASNRAYALEQALQGAREIPGVSVVKGKEPAPELMTPMALSSAHFMKTFEPYLRNLSGSSMRLQQGRLPPIQVANLGFFTGPEAQTETSFVGGLNIATISLGKHLDSEGIQHVLPHEHAHAFESIASTGALKSSGMPPKFLHAISESTADYIQGLVNHMKGNYEGQYGSTRMVEAVIAQIQKAKDLHGESTAIGLDVLLRAHLGNDHEACKELVNAWQQVLQMPEYKSKYLAGDDDSQLAVDTLMFIGLVATIGSAIYLMARRDPSSAPPT